MLVGGPPFYSTKGHEYMFHLIRMQDVQFPEQIKMSEKAKDLIVRLLEKNPKYRLGYGERGWE